MQVGDRIKTFTVKKIVKGVAHNYTDCGKRIPYDTAFMYLESDNGQRRVLELGKKSLRDCVTYIPTWGKSKYLWW
jgi:hypothetical protein